MNQVLLIIKKKRKNTMRFSELLQIQTPNTEMHNISCKYYVFGSKSRKTEEVTVM